MSLTSTARLNFNLTALCREVQLKEATHILLSTYKPPGDFSTYLQLLQNCIAKNALSQGKQIHSIITDRGFEFSRCRFFQNNLVNMYEKCGTLMDARKVFDEMAEQDVSSWNTIIAAYRRHGYPHEALILFSQMQQTDIQPDHFTFAAILPACAKIGALEQGMGIHDTIIERGYLPDVVVANALIDMYAKCGSLDKACEVFDKLANKTAISWNTLISGYAQNGNLDDALRVFKEMPRPDVVSWSALVGGYTQSGFFEKAVEAFKQMQLAGLKPNSTTLASILSACAKMGALETGMDIHKSIIKSGFLSDIIVINALIDMYTKCGSIHKARELFDKMPQRSVVSWNSMIAGYAQNGVLGEVVKLFKAMPRPDIISWSTVLTGYVQNGFVEKALEVFSEMQLTGVKPNSTTFASILPACAKMGGLEQGMDIHKIIIESVHVPDIAVTNSLIDMYAKCGRLYKARELFNKMPQKDVVSWTAMIAGYAQNGFVEKALETYKQMQSKGVKPDSTTFASILPACAKLGALEQGMKIHQSIIESSFLSDLVIANALIDMYSKCGSIHKARQLFDKMPKRDVISWNAIVAGYAQNGLWKDAFKIFELMKHSGTYPDHGSFTCVLFACSHAGLLSEGCKYFNDMTHSYCITPRTDHYVCMVDLLGRGGHLEETLNFIIKMPYKPVVVVWTCFLGACRSHKDIRLGVFTATHLSEMDSYNSATYVLLSNIYAGLGMWGEVQMVRRLIKDREIKKIPGCSWIEGHKMVHVFCVGDRSHPQTHEIYAKLERLSWEMKLVGYFPNLKHVLHDVEEEEKELFLCHHSEKMAIAFGLLNTPPGTTIRIVKNLRVCVDCHTATKFISKIVARQIIVRDANRFHHFKQGQCSCGDYW
ncbi:putative pentatricopeptide repeat-containing protein At3g23330 [Cryptomeria japonica]|uniref:putative pentatricopeptide repeat-containing protein At3g23330 n=1 Tax=Cryptomeria japonica TaxID=3369 RepID=UPI0027DA1401|nr:putative pentatricopeptide repeat-containing protein At3g23330 [Cryptomeria japonica]